MPGPVGGGDEDLIVLVDAPRRVAIRDEGAVRRPGRIEFGTGVVGDPYEVRAIDIHGEYVLEVVGDDPPGKVHKHDRLANDNGSVAVRVHHSAREGSSRRAKGRTRRASRCDRRRRPTGADEHERSEDRDP